MALDFILDQLGGSLLRPSHYTVELGQPILSNAKRKPSIPYGNYLTIHAEDLGVVNYYSDYTARMRIAIQDSTGNDSQILVAEEVYPKAIMPISLGAALSDTYVRYGVNFGFRRYHLVDSGALAGRQEN